MMKRRMGCSRKTHEDEGKGKNDSRSRHAMKRRYNGEIRHTDRPTEADKQMKRQTNKETPRQTDIEIDRG